MNLKNILVFLDASSAGAERLRVAMALAEDHGACLSAVFLKTTQSNFRSRLLKIRGKPSNKQCIFPGKNGQAHLDFDSVERQFHEKIDAMGGDWHPRDHVDMPELVAIAQAADLLVAGQFEPNSAPIPSRPQDIVVACGRPVLMIPYIGCLSPIGRRVLIAWNGSREATRALNDALPLMGGAESVVLIAVRGRNRNVERDRALTDRIVRHLAHHGISAQVDEILSSDTQVSDILLSKSADIATDLIVAGAYHHSPLHEAIFGGTSRELFRSMTVPVFVSH